MKPEREIHAMCHGTTGRPLLGRHSMRVMGARHGFTLLELSVAGFLLAAAMIVTLQTLGWIVQERRAVERRERARQEVANVMEHLAAQDWDLITPSAVAAVALAPDAQKALPSAELELMVETDESEAKKLSIALRWRNHAGEFESPVIVTTWLFRRERLTP